MKDYAHITKHTCALHAKKVKLINIIMQVLKCKIHNTVKVHQKMFIKQYPPAGISISGSTSIARGAVLSGGESKSSSNPFD